MEQSEQYKRLHKEHLEKSFVCEAHGHTIRRYTRLQGECFSVGDTGRAFHRLEEALAHAEKNPLK